MTEEEISMVLNTYMYLDYKEADDGMTMKEIVAELSGMPDCQPGGIHYGEYQVISKASENPEIGNLVIGNQSHLMGYDEGTAACTFQSKEEGSTYVVYRGTSDGEWLDNGIGMTEKSTLQQERALDYFETVVEREQISEADRLIVTGHSKGGNKAQFVTMSTENGDLLDACYSIDGQGFSENAIDGWKEKLGTDGYAERIAKMTGICGENDYVNVLGNGIIPKDQIFYVKTPVEKGNFAGYHDIKYMFASMEVDPVTGEVTYIFRGQKNDYVADAGSLSEYAALLSEAIMKVPPDKRDGCAAVIMQLLELKGDKKTGLNGESISFEDIGEFLWTGLPIIADTLFESKQGLAFLYQALFETGFADEIKGSVRLFLNQEALLKQADKIEELASKIERYESVIAETERDLKLSMKGSWTLSYQLVKKKEALLGEVRKLRKLGGKLKESVAVYIKAEEELVQALPKA